MNIANFSLEFNLDIVEIRELNRMYLKNLYRERVQIFFAVFLVFSVFFNLYFFEDDIDITIWIFRNLILIVLFLIFQYSFANKICKLIFRVTKRLLKHDNFIDKYKFNFTNSLICVHSPLGEFTHRWSQIDKAILTKDFLLLYVKEQNNYIITISNKYNNGRRMTELIAFVEANVTQIIKV